jgi:DNA-damage-inducible protein D
MITVFDNNQSPFDSIRHFNEQGNEFWYARELMVVMGYKDWQKFRQVIQNAIENLETIAQSTFEHFLAVELKTKGRPQLDYKLSRLACYHIALSCDSRGNDSVKMAKHYFAVKTREAEVIIPQQNAELEVLKLKLELLKAEKEVAIANTQLKIADKNLLDTRHYITTALPEVQQQKILGYEIIEKKIIEKEIYKEDEFIRNDSTINKTNLCYRYGILTRNGKADYPRINKILATANLPESAWYEVKDIQTNKELKKEYLNILDNLIIDDSRQLWIGE